MGYEANTARQIEAWAKQLDGIVVDVRKSPTSFRHEFTRAALAAQLGKRYEWRGKLLGGRGLEHRWSEGVRALLPLTSNLILLCQCHAPGDCHRHGVALEFVRQGARVVHVFDDQAIETTELERSIRDGDAYEYEDIKLACDEPAQLMEPPPWGRPSVLRRKRA